MTSDRFKFDRFEKVLISSIVFGLILHLYWIPWPLAGWHSWRQTDTAAIARNFYELELNPLKPRIDWGGSGPGYVETEAQIFTFLIALSYFVVGAHDWVGRVISLIFSTLTAWYIFRYGFVLKGRRYGLSAAAVFFILPMEAYFGTALFPEALLLLGLIAAVFHYDRWLENGRFFDWLFSLFFVTVAVLIKPPSLYIGLPLLYLSFRKYGWSLFKKTVIWLYVVILLVVSALYYYNAHQLYVIYSNTFGIWDYGTGKWLNWDLLLSWKFYNRIIFSNIGERLLTYGGFIAFIIGLFVTKNEREKVVVFWLIAVGVSILIAAHGNFAHDYYQMPVLLPASFIIAGAIESIQFSGKTRKRAIRAGFIFIIAAIPLLSIARNIGYTRHALDDLPKVKFARDLQPALPHDAKVLTINRTNPMLLYHLHRTGWVKIQDFYADRSTGRDSRFPGQVFVVGSRESLKDIYSQASTHSIMPFFEDQNFVCIILESLPPCKVGGN